MQHPTSTRTIAAPATLLCRCFCRDYVTLTGAGLAASAGPPAVHDQDDQETDND